MIALALILSLAAGEPAHGCRRVPADQVVTVESGFVILSTGDLVWYDDAQESGDRYYWGCWLHGKLDRLYVPRDQLKRPEFHGSPHLRRQPHD